MKPDYDSVIFLDVDGVLNDMSDDNLDDDWDMPSDKHLRPFAEIVRATNARIVVTSSWREFYWPMKCLTERLEDWGLDIEDVTPVLTSNRAAEIRTWLDAHPFVKHFVILDDEIALFDVEFANNIVLTRMSDGLLPEHVQPAIRILKGV